MPIKLHLFGTPSIQHAQGATHAIPNTKPALLLIYLATHADWVSRASLASVFQSNGDDSAARHYLRVLVNRAKDLSWADALEVESERLRFCAPTDTHEFQNAIGNKAWSQAFAVHAAPFLAGFEIREAPALETWVELERERHLQNWGMAAIHHAQTLSQVGQHATAKNTLEQLLSHDPLQEDVVVAYMRQCAATGARQEATRAFEKFRSLLQTELDLEPMPETLALLEQIRRAEPVPANAPSTTTQAIPKALLRPPRLLGREHETQAFQGANTTVVLFLGEPGAGKTRLLEELAPRQTCWMRGREGLQGVPYHPIAQWLRENPKAIPDLGAYREDLARLVPETAPGETFGPAEPNNAKGRLLEAMARVFETTQNTIVIDDLQWLDAGSLEFLVMLASRGHTPIVAAARSDEIGTALEETLNVWRGQHAITTINLQRLRPETLQALLEDTNSNTSINLQDLSAKSGGNPFFALELLRDALEGTHSNEQHIPKHIQQLIERRFKRLGGTTQRVLQAASVLREELKPKTLADMIGVSEFAALDALEETERAGFTTNEHFQHDLVRQSLYKSLPETRRKTLHARAASVLDASTDAEVVADHWVAAENTTKAVPFWKLAAQHYTSKDLHEKAIGLLTLVEKNTTDLGEKQEELSKIAKCHRALSNYNNTIGFYQAILKNPANLEMEIRTISNLGWVFFRSGRFDGFLEMVEKLKNLCQDKTKLSKKARKAYLDLMFNYEFSAGSPEAGLEYSRELLKLCDDDVQGYCSATQSIALNLATLKRFEESKQMLKSIEAKIEFLNSRSYSIEHAATWVYVHVQSDDPENCLEYAEKILLNDLENTLETTAVLRNNLSTCYMMLGRVPEAIKHCELNTQHKADVFSAIAYPRLAQAYALIGEEQKAQDALAKAIDLAHTIDFPIAQAATLTAALKVGDHNSVQRAREVVKFTPEQIAHQPKVVENLEQAEKIWLERQTHPEHTHH